MRIAEVIGNVTLSRQHASLTGGRFLVVVPCSLKALQGSGRGDGEDLVCYDDLGAGPGCRIAMSEGGEAAQPFVPAKKPIDAYCACILDCVTL